jgi:hypothetical protein
VVPIRRNRDSTRGPLPVGKVPLTGARRLSQSAGEMDPLDDFLAGEFAKHGHLSEDEKAGMLLGYFSLVIEKMNRQELIAFRAHLLKRFPSGDEQTAIMEVIDGQMALLGIAEK